MSSTFWETLSLPQSKPFLKPLLHSFPNLGRLVRKLYYKTNSLWYLNTGFNIYQYKLFFISHFFFFFNPCWDSSFPLPHHQPKPCYLSQASSASFVSITLEIDVLFLIILLMRFCYTITLVYMSCPSSIFDTITL